MLQRLMNEDSGPVFSIISSSGNSPECTVDRDTHLVYLNAAFLQMIGEFGATGAGVGDSLIELFPDGNRELMARLVEQGASGEINHAVIHCRCPSRLAYIDVVFRTAPGEREEDDLLQITFRDISTPHETEQRISGLAGRLQAVLESSVDLNASIMEPETIYRTTMDKISAAIPADTGTIQLLEGDMLRVVAHFGFDSNAILDSLRFPLDERFPNVRVIRSKRALALADIRHDFPHFLTEQGQFESGHIRSWLGVPIIDRGEVWGMVTLDRKVVDPFDSEDIELAGAIANHAGVAISNSRLYAGLQRANTIQTTLMQELHHRVKNNMQLVSSLISIRSEHLSGETREILGEIRMRILSLAAVHESLYQSPDLDIIELQDYLDRVVQEVEVGYAPRARGIELELDIEAAIRVHIDVAIPLGLIVSELVLNAVKHAFPGYGEGRPAIQEAWVRIGARLSGARSGELQIDVEDNGAGMPDTERVHSTSFGMVLIRTLGEQLGATVRCNVGTERSVHGSGTRWALTVPTTSR
jgi:two-component sensor histidine kinase